MIYLLKKIIPKPLVRVYHYTLAVLAPFVYGHPSDELIVIGVTGTNGKSTTVNIIGKLLEDDHTRVGFATTANFKVGEREWINDTKMTMLGRFQLQKLLRDMVRAGCRYAVIETSSQGIEQFRHIGINYDYAVFTNLTPEHIEAHGGFENYKKAKGKLFARLSKLKRKTIEGKEISKKSVINLDDKHAGYFLSFSADVKIGYTLKDAHTAEVERIYTTSDTRLTGDGVSFNFEGTSLSSILMGEYNVYNLSAALSVVLEEGIPRNELQRRLLRIQGVPGRMEKINEGQNFSVLVDYAPEPQSLQALYATLEQFNTRHVIHVLGSCGGGRDVARRPVLGQLAARTAEYVIVTDEDPYDDEPMEIIQQVAQGAKEAGKIEGENLFIIQDRKEAIRKAIELAGENDLVLITGKGCEQYIMSKQGTKIPHDDREVVRNILKKL
jgi:UDP-N-acetylmuramoyl-L-alanyl-D-glutamate--2,6-diaminopimelate ligase